MVLQEQLCLFEASSPSETALNGRLSRIVTKLFSKVIKSEESGLDPYSPVSLDLESVLCCLEDVLTKAKDLENGRSGLREEAVPTCRNMAIALMTSIVNVRPGEELRVELRKAGLVGSSNVYSLVQSMSPGFSEKVGLQDHTSPKRPPATPAQQTPSKTPTKSSQEVVSLVSAVGSATEGPDRVEAISALKRFQELHGDEELNAHLEEISPTFRAYIIEQLKTSPVSSTPSRTIQNLPMSERIKKLRSKINVLDGNTEAGDADLPPRPPNAAPRETPSNAAPLSPPKMPRKSGLPQTASPGHQGNNSVHSLRQRLAAAQENRPNANIEVEQTPPRVAASTPKSSGSAAALRARLQAMRNQNK